MQWNEQNVRCFVLHIDVKLRFASTLNWSFFTTAIIFSLIISILVVRNKVIKKMVTGIIFRIFR